VFAGWKEPDEKVYKKMMAEDSKKWKLKRFEKDPEQQELVTAIFHKHLDKFYNCYIERAAESNFPLITMLIWAGFASQMNKDGKV